VLCRIFPVNPNGIFEKKRVVYIMAFYSENQIRKRHAEFMGLKKYADKLIFFDHLFGIIPFPFPSFDPELAFLFQKEKTEELLGIYKKERNNRSLTEKKFSYGQDYIFNIRPANSNSSVYSNYILSSFLLRAPEFFDWINQKKTAEQPVEYLLDRANRFINDIEYRLQNKQDKGFSLQCMAVFYKGFYDAFSDQVYGPGKKRKFIELYLYSQGIIYSNYISSLKSALQYSRHTSDEQIPQHLDLSGQLNLLQELGVVDFLKSRYAGLDAFSFKNKLAEILCLITGENTDQKKTVLQILISLNRQRQNQSAKTIENTMQQKIPNRGAGERGKLNV
jgi:hypothetical protein